MRQFPITFFLNSIVYQGPEVEFYPGFKFRKAQADEIALYKKRLIPFFNQITNGKSFGLNYERYNIANEENNGWKSYRVENPDDFKYYLLEGSLLGEDIHNIQTVFEILEPDLRCGLSFAGREMLNWTSNEDGFIGLPGLDTYLYLKESNYDFFIDAVIPSEYFLGFEDMVRRVSQEREKRSFVYSSLSNYIEMRFLPSSSNFKSLGYFVTVESLIAHNPKSTETGDSLSHQIKTKIPLLMRRMSNKIDYPVEWKFNKEDNIWSELYSYRSKIAHGDTIDFTGNFKKLGSKMIVDTFMAKVTRGLLRQALLEPDLVDDLRRC